MDQAKRDAVLSFGIHEGDSYQGPGIYEHYKGNLYLVRGLALHESQLYVLVIYQPLEHGSALEGSMFRHWARPLDDFNDSVWTGEASRPRFIKKSDLPKF